MLIKVIACLSLVTQYESARILAVFPTPSVSHQSVFRVLTNELVKQGHQVHVITPIPEHSKGQAPKNLTEFDVQDLTFKVWRGRYLPNALGKSAYLNKILEKLIIAPNQITDESFEIEEIKELAKNDERYFDILLLEAWVRPALIWSHIFKVPVIKVSSFGAILDNYETVGGPSHPLLYPSHLQHRVHDLTLFEKVQELYKYIYIQTMYSKFESAENKMIERHFGKEAPLLSELRRNVQMLFLNVHPVFEGNLPVPLNVVHLGGLHIQPIKELPKDLKSYLDSSRNGVIYMSFGSNFLPSMITPELVQMFIRVLSRLPYEVLWKWDSIPGIPDNIRISKWFPQADLLHHPKIKLFITQAGLQSTDEAIIAGVPLIGIPIASDQWFNADKYVQHNFGVKLDVETISEIEFRDAIINVIRNDSYRKNIIKFRSIVTDTPQSALHRAIWWSSHLLRHGAHAHRTVTSLAQYLELELLAIVAICVLTVLTVTVLVLRILLKHFCLWFLSLKWTKL